MKVRQNLHQHSCHSCDSACAQLVDIVKDMEKLGVTDYGVSDHLHSRYNLCDIESCRNDIIGWNLQGKLHMGVEASVMCKWECDKIAKGDFEYKGDDPVYGLRFAPLQDGLPEYCLGLDEEDKKRLGIEYVVGGSHWPLIYTEDRDLRFKEIYDQHIWMIENPMIDIIAHPWWSLQFSSDDWMRTRDNSKLNYKSVLEIPDDWNVNLGKLAMKYNKCIEMNFCELLSNVYPDEVIKWQWKWMAQWREMGVKFTFGNDSHSPHACGLCFGAMGQLLDHYGFTDDNIRYFFDK